MGLRNVAKYGGLRSTKTFIVIYTYYVGSHTLFYQKHMNVLGSGWKTNWTNLSGKHTQICMFPYFLVCKLYKEVKTRGGSVPNRLGRI